MGHSHSPHSDEPPSPVALAARRRANLLLTAILVPLGLLAVVAMLLMWPSGDRSSVTVADPYATADGVTFDTGKVQRVSQEDCPSSAALVEAGGTAQQCLVAYTVPNAGGPTIQVEVPPEVAKGDAIEAGDSIRYLNLEAVMQDGGGAPPYVFVDFVRSVPMAALTVLYAGVVIAVARWRGLRALVGLAGAYAVLAGFILPGLVEGQPPLLLGLVGSSVIMFGVLYFAHGFTARTSTALLGTLFGLSITACLAAWATDAAHLVGVDDENAYTLINSSESISVSGIILCGLIIVLGTAAGRVASLVLLMLQLSSSGGTYPVETTPGFFQALHPFMPATYVVNGLRALITGGVDARMWIAVAFLGILALACIVISSVTAGRQRMWTIKRLHPELHL